MTPRIAFIGDLTVDVYRQQKRVHLGGASLNASVWAKRCGATPSILAAVGADAHGKKFLQKLKKETIDTSRVQLLSGKTSTIEIFIDKMGERSYGEWKPGVLAHYHLSYIDHAFLAKHQAASLTVYGPTRHLLDELVTFGKKRRRRLPLLSVGFDDLSQLGKDVAVVASSLDGIDMAILGLDKDVDEDIVNLLRQMSADTGKLIVVTLARYGSLAYQGDQVFVQAPQRVVVKDTTGAGDAFLAGFLVSYLKTKKVQQALAAGTRLASRAITQLGAY